MPENTRVGISNRPTSFGEARSQSQLDLGFDLRTMNAWVDAVDDKFSDISDEITAAAERATEEAGDKGFWGSLATYGTTIGCMLLDLGGGGACTIAGLVAGSATRWGVDALNPQEQNVPGMPTRTDIPIMPDPKYYTPEWQDKEGDVQDITANLGEHVQDIQDFNANAWKVDLLKQVKDSWNAYRVGYSAEKIGLLGETLDPWQFDAFGKEGHLFGWKPSFVPPPEDVLGTGVDVPVTSYDGLADLDVGRLDRVTATDVARTNPYLSSSIDQPLLGRG